MTYGARWRVVPEDSDKDAVVEESGGYSHFFANGTSALYAVLRALGCQDGEVALAPVVCPNVITAILASSNRPCFVDIERGRFGIDPAELRKALGGIQAVIAVHLYGIPCQIDAIADLCREYGVPLVEDCAQAEGAEFNGRPVGDFGDAAVFSYGAGKIIDAGGGGRAFTRDPKISQRLREVHATLPATEDVAQVSRDVGRFYKALYNEHYPLSLDPHRRAFGDLLRDTASGFLGRWNVEVAARVSEGRRTIGDNVTHRRAKARHYAERFANHPRIRIPPLPPGSAPWRFVLLLDPPLRQHVLRRMLSQGLDVSSWYPDISLFADLGPPKAPVANSAWLGDQVLNLWVDAATSDADIDRTCDAVLGHIEAF